MSETIQYFRDSKGAIMAILIPDHFSLQGISFITEDEALQQVAYMGHSKGHVILPHYHNRKPRNVDITSETLVMKKGTMIVTLYEDQIEKYRFIMKKGDILTLLSGGHGFEMEDDVEMVEIKQGPFMGPDDKTRF